MSITRFSGKTYPDQSFTLGLIPREKKAVSESRYDREHLNQPEVNQLDSIPFLLGNSKLGGKFCSLSESPNKKEFWLTHPPEASELIATLKEVDKVDDGDYSNYYNCESNLSVPLFIVSPKSSQRSRGKYGKHGITGYGRRVVKNSCILLEQRYSRKRLGFITCSLPSFSEEIQRALNANWGEVTRRFYQKLKRKAKERGREFIYVGVTEIQEKRFAKYGVPCPHLHFVYLCRDSPKSKFLFSTFDYWTAWNKSLLEVINLVLPNLCMDAITATGSCHGQLIQKSAAGYLGKYISKGSQVLEDMAEQGWEEFPRQWWTASQSVKKLFKESLVRLRSNQCKALFFNLEEYLEAGHVTKCTFVYYTYEGQDICTGLAGTFSADFYRKVVSENRARLGVVSD